jgi:predicted short-subunit dehydrogenase-like oxidoreductase (DUF2520 family)
MALIPTTVIIGAGRLGQGIGTALVARGTSVRFAVRRPGKKDLPAPEGLATEAATYRGARWILIATPDFAIWPTATLLGELGVVTRSAVVLHLSGLHDRGALKPLALSGAALGSFHPLQSFGVPMTAASRLPGSYAGLEGDARAIRAGRRLARTLGMTPLPIPNGAKAAYHAAATFAATYVTVVYDTAVEIASEAGIELRHARAMFLPLLQGTVSNLKLLPPAHALTGAVRRGDVATVKAHLAALGPRRRVLYRLLARQAVQIARRTSTDRDRLAEIERVVGREE